MTIAFPTEIFVVVFPDGGITSFLKQAEAIDFVHTLAKLRSERRGALTIVRYTPESLGGSDNLEGEKK